MNFVILFLGCLFLIYAQIHPKLIAWSGNENETGTHHQFIIFTRRFHLGLGIFFLAGSIFFFIRHEPIWAGVFLGFAPLIAYTWFFWRMYRMKANNSPKKALAIFFVMLILTISLSFITYEGFTPAELKIQSNQVIVQGMYGKSFDRNDIVELQWFPRLPAGLKRRDGFSAGPVRKGHFFDADRNLVLLFVADRDQPVVKIIMKDGSYWIYNHPEMDAKGIIEKLEWN